MIPWRRKWHPTPVLLPGKSHGQRTLVGYSPWGRRVGHDWATSLSLSYNHLRLPRWHFPGKESSCQCRRCKICGLDPWAWKIPRSGRSSGVGSDNPLKNLCMEKSLDRGAWQAIVHRAALTTAQIKLRVFPPLLNVHMTSSSVNKQDISGNHCKACFHARTGVGTPQLKSVKSGLQLICVSEVLMKWSHTHS